MCVYFLHGGGLVIDGSFLLSMLQQWPYGHQQKVVKGRSL